MKIKFIINLGIWILRILWIPIILILVVPISFYVPISLLIFGLGFKDFAGKSFVFLLDLIHYPYGLEIK